MATYQGIIMAEDIFGEVQKKVFIDAIKLNVVQDEMEETILDEKVFIDAEVIYPFLLLEGIASRKKYIHQGHTTWGEDNSPPRRYPLENSWTRKSK